MTTPDFACVLYFLKPPGDDKEIKTRVTSLSETKDSVRREDLEETLKKENEYKEERDAFTGPGATQLNIEIDKLINDYLLRRTVPAAEQSTAGQDGKPQDGLSVAGLPEHMKGKVSEGHDDSSSEDEGDEQDGGGKKRRRRLNKTKKSTRTKKSRTKKSKRTKKSTRTKNSRRKKNSKRTKNSRRTKKSRKK